MEANLANLVAELREGMGEKGHRDGALRTVHGFGYAFSAGGVRLGRRLRHHESPCPS